MHAGRCEDCNAPGSALSEGPGVMGGAVGAYVGGAGGTGYTGSLGVGSAASRAGAGSVRFIPQQTGLTEPWVNVLNLVAHTNYTFHILVMNGVSNLSKDPLPYVTVNITTNQAGRRLLRFDLFYLFDNLLSHQSGPHRVTGHNKMT